MDSLVNFDGFSDVVNNALDKLSSATGWVVNRPSLKQQAIALYVQEVKDGDYTSLEKAAFISNARKIIKEYSRQCNIVAHAIRAIGETAKPQDVSDDFLTLFMDKARLVSDEDFQLIWGKILAEECNIPNSIPKILLNILGYMDKQDAERFTKICSVSAYLENGHGKECFPIILKEHLADYYSQIGITFDSLVSLRAMGLIDFDISWISGGYTWEIQTQNSTIHYFDTLYQLPDGIKNIPIGHVLYTKAGHALCNAIDANKQEDFFEKYCIPFFESWLKTLENGTEQSTA